jgi:hypothetical protein
MIDRYRVTLQAIPGSTTLFTADQMDDLHWFFRGFYTKRILEYKLRINQYFCSIYTAC